MRRMKHRGTIEIETERILLRRFHSGDGQAMYRNWASDPDVARFLTWPPHASAEISEQIASQWAADSEKADFYQWAIVPKSTGEPIGSLSVVRQNDDLRQCEIGYCMGKRWWGHGLMAEAVRAVLRYLILDVGMIRVQAKHDVNNPNSGRVMQKAGMTFEGILRQADRNNTGFCDVAVYSILANELTEEHG